MVGGPNRTIGPKKVGKIIYRLRKGGGYCCGGYYDGDNDDDGWHIWIHEAVGGKGGMASFGPGIFGLPTLYVEQHIFK